jgi:hypothetical protein
VVAILPAEVPTWRISVLLPVWVRPLRLSGKGEAAKSYATAGRAFEVFSAHKPLTVVRWGIHVKLNELLRQDPTQDMRCFCNSALEWLLGMSSQMILVCRIWGFHSGGYEEYHLLENDAVRSACHLLARWFCWTYFFDPENGGDMLLRNVGWNSADYTASYPRRRFYSDCDWLPVAHLIIDIAFTFHTCCASAGISFISTF